MLVSHQSDYNFQECDIQAGESKIIISKHMNLRHRQESEQTNDKLKCDECNMQFSSKWSCNNHKRDKHEMKRILSSSIKDLADLLKIAGTDI